MIPDQDFFSTGEVAAHCAVTANAVLKWIKSGQLRAERTPGGHHRIPRNSLITFMKIRQEKQERGTKKKIFQYCWEFHGDSDGVQDGCRQCIVYRSRTGRCFELAKLPAEMGHSRLFCTNTCEECEYFEMFRGMNSKVLFVTNRTEVQEQLKAQAGDFDFTLRFTESPYRCSRVIESYVPDYIVIECSQKDCCHDFITELNEDFRIPMTRIILVGEPEYFPSECEQMVFAYMEAPLNLKELDDLIDGR